jgi:hypothetical protein
MLTIDAQVHAYERNHPGRPWHAVLTGPREVTGGPDGRRRRRARGLMCNVGARCTWRQSKVRNALSGLSFVAAFEAAYYVNEKWEKAGKEGNLVSFHCHAVVWATHYSQLSRHRKRIKPRFRPILGNKSGVRFDALKKAEDVGKALRYQAKMPARGYRTVSRGWGKKTQTSAKLSYLSRYRLFTALQQYDLLDFWLAGCEGATILREARRKLNAHRERQRFGPMGDSHLRCSSRTDYGGSRLRAF